MKNKCCLLFALLLVSCVSIYGQQTAINTVFKPWDYSIDKNVKGAGSSQAFARHPRLSYRFDNDWTFNYFPEATENTELSKPGYDDSKWQGISIPHTWQTFETTGDRHPYMKSPSERDDPYWWQGHGYYRKSFHVARSLADKKIFIEFDGVQKYSKIYLNGIFLGDHEGGYTSFYFDLTDAIRFGENNLLTVVVNNNRRHYLNIPPMTAGNWNVYGGIYRGVRLVVTNKLFIPYQGSYKHEGGTFVTTPTVSKKQGSMQMKTYIKNEYPNTAQTKLVTIMFNAENEKLYTDTISGSIEKDSIEEFTQSFEVTNPHLWSPETPYLYKAVSTVFLNNEKQDTYETYFGFRWFKWDYLADNLILNGDTLNIKGFNRHQEYPWLGDAIPYWITRKDMLDIKYGLGTNFMRPGHYPNDPLVYHLADSLGIIMVNEVPNIKRIDFSERVQRQNVKEMIRRDRNHPSILFWSMGNETSDGADSAWAIEEDTSRIIHARKAKDVGAYVSHTHKQLDLENLLRVTVHGWYTKEDIVHDFDANPINGQDAGTEVWQHEMAQVQGGSIRGVLNDNMVGWIYEDHGADRDYDNAPLQHINYKGWVDSYRIPKYLYFLTQANRLDKPILFMQPHHWKKKNIGKKKTIVVDSNCDSISLFVNKKMIRTLYPGITGFNSVEVNDLTVQDAELRAIGYHKDTILERTLRILGKPFRIRLESTHDRLVSEKNNLAIVTAYVEDEQGNVIYNSTNDLQWQVQGEGTLVGLELYKSDIEKWQELEGSGYTAGPTSNIVRATDQSGEIRLTVNSPGLESDTLVIPTGKSNNSDSKYALIHQPELKSRGRIPVVRNHDFTQNLRYEDVIQPISGNKTFQHMETSLRKAIANFIEIGKADRQLFSEAFELLIDRIEKDVIDSDNELIGDSYNFSIQFFNNYVALAKAIDAKSLNLTYTALKKQWYFDQIATRNTLLEVERELDFIQRIQKDHILLEIQNPDSDHPKGSTKQRYAKSPYIVWEDSVKQAIFTVFPEYAVLDTETRTDLFSLIANLSPNLSYDEEKSEFVFGSDERLLLLPGNDIELILKDL